AAYVVLVKDALRGLPTTEVLGAFVIQTGILLSPILLWKAGAAQAIATEPSKAAAILYLVVVCTLIAYGTWMWALSAIRATTSAIVLLVEVAVGTALGALLLHESFSVPAAIGALLLAAGLAAAVLHEGVEAVQVAHEQRHGRGHEE
ncbi:MAG: EamA family transporter, partial [Methanobacteriota archaeon]